MLAVWGNQQKGVRDLLEGSLPSQRNRHNIIIQFYIYKINSICKKKNSFTPALQS